ncbi:hypothetical protein B0T09DRAFT_160257 [Sordaria sp. MPI-SDFR-AT-0083]|nr:hypothetical protein B0T09DRAFT_160257 [Sordaria sp. MPI-SDFR-AT-0083]
MDRYAETTVTTEYDSADSDASYPTVDLEGYHEHDQHGSRRRRPDVPRSGRKAFKEPSPHRRRSPRSKLRGRMHCGCGAEAVVELSVDDTLDSESDKAREYDREGKHSRSYTCHHTRQASMTTERPKRSVSREAEPKVNKKGKTPKRAADPYIEEYPDEPNQPVTPVLDHKVRDRRFSTTESKRSSREMEEPSPTISARSRAGTITSDSKRMSREMGEPAIPVQTRHQRGPSISDTRRLSRDVEGQLRSASRRPQRGTSRSDTKRLSRELEDRGGSTVSSRSRGGSLTSDTTRFSRDIEDHVSSVSGRYQRGTPVAEKRRSEGGSSVSSRLSRQTAMSTATPQDHPRRYSELPDRRRFVDQLSDSEQESTISKRTDSTIGRSQYESSARDVPRSMARRGSSRAGHPSLQYSSTWPMRAPALHPDDDQSSHGRHYDSTEDSDYDFINDPRFDPVTHRMIRPSAPSPPRAPTPPNLSTDDEPEINEYPRRSRAPRETKESRGPKLKTILSKTSLHALNNEARTSTATDLCEVWRAHPEDWESPYSSVHLGNAGDERPESNNEPLMMLELEDIEDEKPSMELELASKFPPLNEAETVASESNHSRGSSPVYGIQNLRSTADTINTDLMALNLSPATPTHSRPPSRPPSRWSTTGAYEFPLTPPSRSMSPLVQTWRNRDRLPSKLDETVTSDYDGSWISGREPRSMLTPDYQSNVASGW